MSLPMSPLRALALTTAVLALACAKGSDVTGGSGGTAASGGTGGTGGDGTGGTGGDCVATEEICNGVDDDCDNLVDEIDGQDVCPGQNPSATDVTDWSCQDGACVIDGCVDGKGNLDADVTNGCECAVDDHAAACPMAAKITVTQGMSQTITGVVEKGDASDYVVIQFSPPAIGQPYHPKIQLTQSANGAYAMDVLVDCNGTAAGCSTSGTPVNDEMGKAVETWEQAYTGYVPGAGCCTDNTTRASSLRVRIFRKNGDTPTACETYEVVASSL